MTNVKYPSGGVQVKASTLQINDTIRDPRKVDRVLIVTEAGTTIFARGYAKGTSKYHVFLHPDTVVVKITNATPEEVV